MGSICSIPLPFRMRHEEDDEEGSRERGRVNLTRQISYDIYKIEGAFDFRDDFQDNRLVRRPSLRYYGVSKSTINRIHPQLPSTLPSFRSVSSARIASFSDWTQTQQHSSTELALDAQELGTESSSPSSPASTSSSDSFETNPSDQSPSVDPALEQALEKSARVEEAH